jgi:hypothetical protein
VLRNQNMITMKMTTTSADAAPPLPPCDWCRGLKSAAVAQHVVCLRKQLESKGSDVESKLGAQLLQLASNHSKEDRYGPKTEEGTIEPDCAGCLQILLQLPNLSTSTVSEDSTTPSNLLSRALQQAASGDCVSCSRLILDWFMRNDCDLSTQEWTRAVEAAVWQFSLNTLKLLLIAAPADMQLTLRQAALYNMCRFGHLVTEVQTI